MGFPVSRYEYSGMQGGAWNSRTVTVSGPGGSISRPLGLPKCDAYFDKTEVWMGVNDNHDEGLYGATGAGYGRVTDRGGNVGKYIVGGDGDLKDITLTVKVPGGGGWIVGSAGLDALTRGNSDGRASQRRRRTCLLW